MKRSKYYNSQDARGANLKHVPKTIKDALFITQEDKSVILDRAVSIAEFFQLQDWTNKDGWTIIQEYNKFIFERVDVLKMKIVHLQESNDHLRDELQLLQYTNAEYITILKNHHVDVPRIQSDARKKLEEKTRERAELEKQNPLASLKIT